MKFHSMEELVNMASENLEIHPSASAPVQPVPVNAYVANDKELAENFDRT